MMIDGAPHPQHVPEQDLCATHRFRQEQFYPPVRLQVGEERGGGEKSQEDADPIRHPGHDRLYSDHHAAERERGRILAAHVLGRGLLSEEPNASERSFDDVEVEGERDGQQHQRADDEEPQHVWAFGR
ncbi:MAG: hypothetical protein ABEL51_13260 [Salinibacter sp.]